MSYSINRSEILGNWVDKPELRYTPSGVAVASGRVATNREWFDKESQQKKSVAEYHSVVFWDKPAEIVSQLVEKGDKVYITGRLQTRRWEDKDGVTRYTTEIIVTDFVLLTPRKKDVIEQPPQEEPVGVVQKDILVEDVQEVFGDDGSVADEENIDMKGNNNDIDSDKIAEEVLNGLSDEAGSDDDIPF